VPALIGCLTLLTHWHHGPPLVLLSLAGLLGMPGPHSRRGYPYAARFQAPTLMDLVLCIAVLGYVLGHYRLLSLMRTIFPADSRRLSRQVGKLPEEPHRRSADLVTHWEMTLLGLALPMWSGLAVLVWTLLMEGTPSLDVPRPLWRVLQIGWAALALLATTGIAAGFLRRMTATPEESLLYLQDELWRHTRREQSLLHRWLSWTRRRVQRNKETS
jgi:hypothetical protein